MKVRVFRILYGSLIHKTTTCRSINRFIQIQKNNTKNFGYTTLYLIYQLTQITQRIHMLSVDNHTEMAVYACHSARSTCCSNHLSACYLLSHAYFQRRVVCIQCGNTAAMVNYNVIAIAEMICSNRYGTGFCSINVRAIRTRHINTVMIRG